MEIGYTAVTPFRDMGCEWAARERCIDVHRARWPGLKCCHVSFNFCPYLGSPALAFFAGQLLCCKFRGDSPFQP